ncbi:uroporphyrinogen-III synthase [Aureispira anguillae]|uniref:Uroporphyrinogen-III synthase n=1 Tax=Aureispira anguillae TaxID=2864201 RepID=A0A915YIL4_9BACT|nr:uroporphyrinogen-III synthase [Aureispira anguillae]BDS13877.1 uroporphyrinogen-III synthase [Aureispira anguillae]
MAAKKNPTVFISRALNPAGAFHQLLHSKTNLIGLSLIEFEPLVFGPLPSADWLFFYSKKGIQYCLSQLDDLDTLPPIGVMGQASADFLSLNYKIQAQFIGTGDPIETAQKFSRQAKGKKVIFAQAQYSKQSVQQLLGESIQSYNLLTYTNCVKTDFELPWIDILVFTSPLNVAAYFAQYPYCQGQQIVSIGNVTAKALLEHHIDHFIIAESPHEQSLAKACLGLIS